MILVWLGALLVGLSLGLLGSGGSILTVPVLVYLVGQHEKVAIAGSLAIVGAISLAGTVPYAWRSLVDWRSVWLFGLPGMAGAYGGAQLARFVPGAAQLMLFALVMLAAAVFMFRGRDQPAAGGPRREAWKIVVDGSAVGVLTGLVGVGGGFLIVPALVLLGGLPMQLAVGTSLLIISLKSATGLAGYLDVLEARGLALDWGVIGLFIALGVVGGLAGYALASRLPSGMLRRVFAAVLVVMAGAIVGQQLLA